MDAVGGQRIRRRQTQACEKVIKYRARRRMDIGRWQCIAWKHCWYWLVAHMYERNIDRSSILETFSLTLHPLP